MTSPVSITLDYQPREAFLPFHNRKNRFANLVVHRRAGKTVAVVNDLLIGALECAYPDPQFAYIAPTYNMAKRIAWEYLKHYAMPLLDQVHEAELRVTLKNRAKIFLLGAEKMHNLRGMYLDGAALDEYAQIRPTAVSQVILPSLSDRNGWMVLMGTPRGKNHFYDSYVKALNDPTWFSMFLPASQSGIIPEEQLKIIRAQMDDSDYLQEFECSFDAALKGAIYGREMDQALAEGRIAAFDLDPALPVDCVADLGYTDDTVLGFFQRHRNNRVLIHEIYINNEQEWDCYLDEMDNRNVRDVYLPHDAKAKNLQTGRSIVEQTIKRGYHPRIVPDHKLRDGISNTRKFLPFTYWNYPLCSQGVEGMKSYRREWDDDHSCYKERPVHDWASHIADMVRYMATVCGITLPPPPVENKKQVEAAGLHYAFNLEDLFKDPRTNPGLYQSWSER